MEKKIESPEVERDTLRNLEYHKVIKVASQISRDKNYQ